MLRKVKQNSLKKHIEKNLSKRDFSKRNEPLKSLGFVVDEAFYNDFEKLYEFGTSLGLQPKDVKIFSFVETRKKLPSLRQNQITNKEFTWRGEIKSKNAQEFLEVPLDVLIGFYPGKHEYLSAMVVQSKAKFTIGFKGADERLYDLLLAVAPDNLDDFKSEVIKYLKIFKKI
ncbi:MULTISPECIES: DUF6913 domain-containing protein [Aequorivita]|uniref:Uncharacterized protein n=2 Tax=Aequorivita TaxID=153265 RepID=A0ABU9NH82_9FLAO|nr:hypothetical protein [Aequorivita sp. Ant34-E75]WGF92588.1 hypothetical protein QCQ61_15450 [Aequorivita sp. Ant34-E75]